MNFCLNVLYDSQIFLSSAAFIVVILLVWAQLNAITPRQASNGNNEEQTPTLIIGFVWIYFAITVALGAFALHVLDLKNWAVGFFALSFLMTAAHAGGSILEKLCRYWTGKAIGSSFSTKRYCLFTIALLTLFGLAVISFSLVDIPSKHFLWIGFIIVLFALVLFFVALKRRKNNDREDIKWCLFTTVLLTLFGLAVISFSLVDIASIQLFWLLIGFLMVLPAVIGIIVLFFMALRTGTSKTVNSKEEDCGKIAAAIIAIWMLLCSIKTTLNKKHD